MATWDTKDYGWGSSIKAPNYSGAFSSDRDSAFSNAWKTGFDAENAGENISKVFSSLFDKAKKTDKYRSWGEQGFRGGSGQFGASFGDPIYGRGSQVLDNLSVVYPQQHAPMFIPGTEGKRGLGGTIGTLAGIGASFIPGLGPGIAAAMPAIGGNIGSMFG